MKNRYQKWFLVLIAGVAFLATACSSKEAPTQPAAAVEQDKPAVAEAPSSPAVESRESAVAAPASAESMEITGLVEQAEGGIVISTEVLDYHVAGQDLSDMIGKTVKVTGAVQEQEGRYTINILSVMEVQE